MKYSKAAAVVAGSLVALGVASVAGTAHAAEPVPGGKGGSRQQAAQPNEEVTTSTPKFAPLGKVGSLLGKSPQAQAGKALGGSPLGLPLG